MATYDEFVQFFRNQTGVLDSEVPDNDPLLEVSYRQAQAVMGETTGQPVILEVLGRDIFDYALYNYGVHWSVLYSTNTIGQEKLYGLKEEAGILNSPGVLTSSSNGGTSVSTQIPAWALRASSGSLAKTQWGQEFIRLMQPLKMLTVTVG